MAKKIALFSTIFFSLVLLSCQQVSDQALQVRQEAEKKIGEIQTQYESAKDQVIETKAQIDQKVEDVQNAAGAVKEAVDAVGKIGQ